MVVVFVAAAGVSALYVRGRAYQDGEAASLSDAQFGATQAGLAIAHDLAALQEEVVQTAAAPGLEKTFAAPAGCTLSFGGLTVFPTGHVDIIDPKGVVACTSLPASAVPRGPVYGGQVWLRQATAGPKFTGPLVDPVTKQNVIVAAAPIPDGGFVAGFVDVVALGPALAAIAGGPRGLEFLVTTSDGLTIVTRSVSSARWTGATLAGTAFARAPIGPTRPDVDGTPRLYASTTVGSVHWNLYAGANRRAATASADDLFHRNAAIILLGLLGTLVASLFVYRRLARPIRQLRAAVANAGLQSTTDPIEVRGPAEVTALAGDFNRLVATVDRELTERLRAQASAEDSERTYRLLFQNNPLSMWVYDQQTLALLEVNDAAVAHYGYAREEFLSMTIGDLRPSEDLPALLASAGNTDVLHHSGPWRHLKKDGSLIDVDITSHVIAFQDHRARLVIAEDVTERARLERLLRQSQKLESLGQLAGGVAHDFNNLLNVIRNYGMFVERDLTAAAGGSERFRGSLADLEQIREATERAARLTRQLLTFARQDVGRPEVIDVNDLVQGVQKLLGRTLGEHVLIGGSLASDVCPVKADRGQIEQVLVNLAVNARDAMPAGGTLTIDTDSILVDESFAATRPALRPGTYARIRVGDTGQGMERSVMEHVFEPFFTTKPPGQGTGLGLATVYGIVVQAGGTVHIYSEVGLGTTVSVLLPDTSEALSDASTPTQAPHVFAGGTVLVVEDEDALREVARRILEENGFRVLTAAGAAEALTKADQHEGRIDLILTDVIMPEVLGKELVATLAAGRPESRVLYMSGYARPFLASTGTLEPGVMLIEKPFSAAVLLERIGEALAGDVVRPLSGT
jgi:PAS domain S-box-containing protein